MRIDFTAVDEAFLLEESRIIAPSGQDGNLQYRPGGVLLSAEETSFFKEYFPEIGDSEVNQMVHSICRFGGDGAVSAYASFNTNAYKESSLTFCGVAPDERQKGLSKEVITAALAVLKRVRGNSLKEVNLSFLENVPNKVRCSVVCLIEGANLEATF